jgi:hypothetical protein
MATKSPAIRRFKTIKTVMKTRNPPLDRDRFGVMTASI